MNNTLLDGMNEQQQIAVQHNKGPLLILAGAGSGKTRVLTHRIAYLISEFQVNPWNILALTFTNKAAREMRERVDRIVGYGASDIWVSTFHSTCVRILRRNIEAIGYNKSFTIYDSDDQKSLMRDICKYLGIDTKKFNERSILSTISHAKDELIGPVEYAKDASDIHEKTCARAYTEYQKRLHNNNALDFDDLIMKTVELFRSSPEILSYYRQRFQYVMVDEYQDTNTAQFVLISLLAVTRNDSGAEERNICVVGDDDQSIYKFRGANIYNILNFEKVYPETKVIKLEQNYRSKGNILDAANAVIRNNSLRKDKALWSNKDKGDPIYFTQYETDREEASAIVNDIARGVSQDTEEGETPTYQDFAILYRTNAQSRVFEEALITANVPYRIVGAVNFYARKEIKDCLAYLKTINNGMDDQAVKRIINVPKRGIGLTTIDRIMEYSISNDISFYSALADIRYVDGVNRAAAKIEPFVALIEGLKHKLEHEDGFTVESLMHEILSSTGYLDGLKAMDTEESRDRVENIEEFVNRIALYQDNCEERDEEATLSGFLEEIALVADIDNVNEDTDQVLLMTLHSAKGLEFPYVYICGMEDHVFPGSMALYSPDQSELEEERRLCYVGITRAMSKLSLSCAKKRMKNGEFQYNPPSRFLTEIPRHLMQYQVNPFDPRVEASTTADSIRHSNPDSFGGSGMRSFRGAPAGGTSRRSTVSANPLAHMSKPSGRAQLFTNNPYIQKGLPIANNVGANGLGYQEGDTVQHIKFGKGIVNECIENGNDFDVVVDFENFGIRKMRASFAKLKKV